MLQTLFLSVFFLLSSVPFWTSELIADEPAKNSPDQPQGQASTAQSRPLPASSLATVSSGPTTALSDPLREALEFYRKGDFDRSIKKYEQLLHESPNLANAYAGLTRVYLKKKDVQQAYDTVSKGLQVADSAIVRVALAEVYFRQGKIHEAEQEWVNVINSGHQDARAYMGLARVRWAISMYKSARTMIDKAHELDPSDPEITNSWMGKLSRGERIRYLEEYLAQQTFDDPETRASMQHYLDFLKARAKDSRGACHLVSTATTTETKLEELLLDSRHLRGYGLSVSVNDKKSRLLLDTGASGIMVNRNLAQKAGVTRLSDMDISGIGDKGNKSGYVGLANSLKIGELEFQNCPVHVLDERSVVGEDGLIGTDVFASFLVDLDFPNEKLRLRALPKRPDETATKITLQTERDDSNAQEEEPTDEAAEVPPTKKAPAPGPQDRYVAPEMKSYTQVYRFGHHLLVPTLIGDASPKLFVLDTGGFNNLISLSAASEITKVRLDSGTIVKGISGSVKNVYRADKAVIRFGHLQQENQDLVSFDLTHTSERLGTEVSGILGFTMLRMLDIQIDYRDGLVDFSYDPKRWNH